MYFLCSLIWLIFFVIYDRVLTVDQKIKKHSQVTDDIGSYNGETGNEQNFQKNPKMLKLFCQKHPKWM